MPSSDTEQAAPEPADQATRPASAGVRASWRSAVSAGRGRAPTARRLLLIIWPFLAIVLVLVLIALASVDILAAGRSYSEGESLWSKGQKTAVFHLIRYAETADEAHYLKYRAAIAVPLGDQIARLEMEKPEFDPAIARAGLLQAKTHPDDVPGVIRLFRIFRKLDYIDRAIRVWTEGDALINALVAEAEVLHATIQSGRTDRESLEPILGRIRDINDKLTPLEDAFTFTLGEATRWSKLVLLGLIVAVAATLIPIGILFSYRMVRNSAAFEDALRASEERFTLAVTGSNDGLWDWNVSAGEVYFSPRFKQLLGYSDAELPNDGTSFLSRLHPDDRERALRKLELHLRSGSLYDDEFRLLTKSGEYRWFHARGQSVRNEAGDPARMAGSISDVTERKLAEVQLFAEKERAQVTLESIADAVITTDTEGCVEYMNPIAESLTGWQSERARGQPLGTVFRTLVESSRETPRDLVEVVLREGRAVQETADIVLARSDGAEIPVTESASPIRDRNGAITGVVVVFHDVSRERQYAAKLTYQATHDALTGLINRREFERRLGLALGAVTDMGRHHAVMYLDLDQFKIVNDTCGHAAGDELMRQASVLLQQRLREGDTLARLGGDEFGVLLENCPPEHARRIADELRQTITDFHFAWHDRSFNIGVSIGLVNLEGYMTLAEVLSAADAACYMAKDKGRNRVQEYRPDDRELSLRQGEMEWVGRIQQAIEEGRLCLHAQEIAPISASAHRRGHFELLLRMVDEHGELVPPMAFIPAAERYNLMSQLDRWVIRTALATLRELQREGRLEALGVCAINLSGASIGDERFLDFVREQVKASGVPRDSICFEITETAAIASLGKATHFIQELKALGCLFSLDDFGAGMSSFAYLKHLPVDFLKIDGSFVKDLADDPLDRAMVVAINDIGHVMGKKTIAEFVEDTRTLELLKEIGVDYAQGIGVARARPFTLLARAVEARHAARAA